MRRKQGFGAVHNRNTVMWFREAHLPSGRHPIGWEKRRHKALKSDNLADHREATSSGKGHLGGPCWPHWRRFTPWSGSAWG